MPAPGAAEQSSGRCSWHWSAALTTAQVAAPGVWIAMSGQVFDGLKVKKDRAAGKFVAI